jgi:hypothetical protein
LSQIIADLTKLNFSLQKKLSPAVILDGIELICGFGCVKDRVEQTLRAGWASDPVHPNAHIYVALNLLEKLSAASDGTRQPGMERKRKRSESSNSSATASHHNPSGPASSQLGFRGHFIQRGNAFRGQFRGRGRGRGWDADSAYSGNSYCSNNRGGGPQDRGRGHRGRAEGRP